MSVSKEEFVCLLPNRFYWKVTGTRWTRGGLQQYVGKEGVAWIIAHQSSTSKDEIKQMLGWPADQRLMK